MFSMPLRRNLAVTLFRAWSIRCTWYPIHPYCCLKESVITPLSSYSLLYWLMIEISLAFRSRNRNMAAIAL